MRGSTRFAQGDIRRASRRPHQGGAAVSKSRALRAASTLAAVVVASLLAAPQVGTAGATDPHAPKPTIVLVHGAWADASGWTGVAERLQQQGYSVIAPANPLRSVSGDSQYLASVLATISGPVS